MITLPKRPIVSQPNWIESTISFATNNISNFFQEMKQEFRISTNFSDHSISKEVRRATVIRFGCKLLGCLAVGSVFLSVIRTAILITTLAAVAIIARDLIVISLNQRKKYPRLYIAALSALALNKKIPLPKMNADAAAAIPEMNDEARMVPLKEEVKVVISEIRYELRAAVLSENTYFPFMQNIVKYALQAFEAYS